MKVFRRNQNNLPSGDAIPFFHDGVYHLFYLTSPPGTTRWPQRVRTTWQHARSTDLVTWEELPPALVPGNEPDPDANGCWTGSVIFADGMYHIFYTGYHISGDSPQTICHATSKDSVTWTKDSANPYIVPDTKLYENIDWRDPYVFFNTEDDCYWMILSGRHNAGPDNRRGCVILYKSTDLKTFEHYGPIYDAYHTNCPECPEMWKMDDFWYLSYSRFSERAQTFYRYSKSPYGPWRTPVYDGIDGRRFYAAKSLVNDEGRRFYFGWLHDREGGTDDGWWQWGGVFGIPHEVAPMGGGNLDVFMPEEFHSAYTKHIPTGFTPKLGDIRLYGDKAIELKSTGTLSYGYFDTKETGILFECDVLPTDIGDYFGITLKTDEDLDKGYLLVFDYAMQRLSVNKMPAPLDPFWATLSGKEQPAPEADGPRVCEKPFRFEPGEYINVKIVLEHDSFEIFVDDMIAFSYRAYEEAPYNLGVFAQDNSVEFHNLSIKK